MNELFPRYKNNIHAFQTKRSFRSCLGPMNTSSNGDIRFFIHIAVFTSVCGKLRWRDTMNGCLVSRILNFRSCLRLVDSSSNEDIPFFRFYVRVELHWSEGESESEKFL